MCVLVSACIGLLGILGFVWFDLCLDVCIWWV